MKKLFIFISLLVFTSMFLAAEESDTWDWKDNFASTTYGVALMPVDFNNVDTGSSNNILLPGIDIRLFNGKNITKKGGFYTGTEVGLLIFFSGEGQFEETDNIAAASSVTYSVVNNDAFIGTVFVLAKYGYRLDLGIKLFGISLGWELGMGARIAVGSYDFEASIGSGYASRGLEVITPDITMILDTAVEASVRIGTTLRLVGRVGFMLTPPFLDDNGTNAAGDGSDPVTDGEASSILGSYDIESYPIIATARIGFIVSY